MTFVEKVLALVGALRSAGIEFGIGGALALGYHTDDPRTTADIDVNISVPTDGAEFVLNSLPKGIDWDQSHLDQIQRDGQTRAYWRDGHTPVDLFFPQADFHDSVARETREVPFGETSIPIISADHLAVFKALFDRPKDWVDIQAMVDSGSVNLDRVRTQLQDLLGPDDFRLSRLGDLRPATGAAPSTPVIDWPAIRERQRRRPS